MIYTENLLKVIQKRHVSEKVSNIARKTNTLVLRVTKNATKLDIKNAVQKLFTIEIKAIRTLIIKGKIKHYGKRIGCRSDWKKAYITLKTGQKLDFTDSTE